MFVLKNIRPLQCSRVNLTCLRCALNTLWNFWQCFTACGCIMCLYLYEESGYVCWVVGRTWSWILAGKKAWTNGDRKARGNWYTLSNFQMSSLKAVVSNNLGINWWFMSQIMMVPFFSHWMEAAGECMLLNPSYKPPAGYKPVYKEAKLFIPVSNEQLWQRISFGLWMSFTRMWIMNIMNVRCYISHRVCRWRTIRATTS